MLGAARLAGMMRGRCRLFPRKATQAVLREAVTVYGFTEVQNPKGAEAIGWAGHGVAVRRPFFRKIKPDGYVGDTLTSPFAECPRVSTGLEM
jgi:hypothetical protein